MHLLPHGGGEVGDGGVITGASLAPSPAASVVINEDAIFRYAVWRSVTVLPVDLLFNASRFP